MKKHVMKSWLRRNRTSRLAQAVAGFAEGALEAYHNENNIEFETNGEANILATVSASRETQNCFTVFDVGAQRGRWTARLLDFFPTAFVHCFEPADPVFPDLEAKFGSNRNIHLNRFGLSSSSCVRDLNFVPDATGLSTVHENLLPDLWRFSQEKISCQFTTGDEYLSKMDLSKVDYLKIDVEGHEYDVLVGLAQSLEAGKVDIIQFEHGFLHITAHRLLFDFYRLLKPLGYEVGRVYPTHVGFKEYDLRSDDRFRMGNYLAVKRSNRDLLSRLSG